MLERHCEVETEHQPVNFSFQGASNDTFTVIDPVVDDVTTPRVVYQYHEVVEMGAGTACVSERCVTENDQRRR